MARTTSTIAGLIGGIPPVRTNHVAGDGVDMVAKVKAFNPASSVGDRVTRSIIDATEASGALAPGGTIVETTSDNTGIALSMVGTARGYKVVIVMPASMSVERRMIVRIFGVELVLTDPEGGISTAVAETKRIAPERPDTTIASRFTNPADPAARVAHTSEEIWADTDGQVDAFIAGVGTDGTISGAAKVLKEKNPNVCIVVAQPAGSPLLTGDTLGPHDIQGLMPNFVPGTLDTGVVDEVVSVETAHALGFTHRTIAEEGLPMGISSDAALAGAAAVTARPELAGKKIVTLLPDTGERYLSTALFAGLED